MMIRGFLLILLSVMAFSVSNAQAAYYPFSEKQNQSSSVDFNINESQSGEHRSPFLAAILSLAVPGMGELYADNFQLGKYFFGAEIGLWLAYTGISYGSDWMRENAQAFAITHAGANYDNKDDQYQVNIGNFANTEDYNQAKLINRQYEMLYDQSASSLYLWQWDTDENRLQYRSQRIKADDLARNLDFVVGAMVINRVISAFIAARSAGDFNRKNSGLNFEISAAPIINSDGSGGMVLKFKKTF